MKLATLLTMAELEQITRQNRSHLYKMAREGLIPSIRIGRSVRFHPEQIEEWMRNGGQALEGGWRHQAA